MRLNIHTTAWLALVLAALLAGTAVADDRDFLRKLSAPPNLIFILDTSGSMVGSPEEPGYQMNSRVPYGMVPGGGDDYYSRMGIAKRVIREFLADVTDANYVLAGYAQEPPADLSNPIPTKHWVYEAVDQDNFHLVEQQYAYRLGYSETHTGVFLDNPEDIYLGSMVGYTPYFDPATSAVADRFGPVRAFDANPLLQYDMLPVYFGSCILDDKADADATNDEILCGDGIFPFYDTGERDASNNMITEDWYYGDGEPTFRFPDCVAWKTATFLAPDDGCLSFWEDNTGTIVGHEGHRVEFKRRIRLEIPATNPSTGFANHPLGIFDPDGTPLSGDEVPVGNELAADLMAENYDLDATTPDMDYDEDMAFDWVLYVDAVEQLQSRECGNPRTPTLTPTPSNTPTETPTNTYTYTNTYTPTYTPSGPTHTPTPIPLNCDDFYIEDALERPGWQDRRIDMTLTNDTPYEAYLTYTFIEWSDSDYSSSTYLDDIYFYGDHDGTYYYGNDYSSPTIVITTVADDIMLDNGDDDEEWYARVRDGYSFVGTTCVQLDFTFPDYGSGTETCSVSDCVTYVQQTPTNTPTYTNSPTGTNTYTPSKTYTPSNTPTGPTATPTPTRSNTPTLAPVPATNTPTPTTAVVATNTPTTPPTATYTPTPNIND